ncbi:hypothetical protein SAMN05216420_11423 [Nitrosospira sp. Nl5]|nr:hypothetical protein SAMN05216420_11423 [Nitrosospira sp. Nl5]
MSENITLTLILLLLLLLFLLLLLSLHYCCPFTTLRFFVP